MEYLAIVQPAGVLISVIWQLGRGTRHVPDSLEYPRGDRLEMDRGPEGQSVKQSIAILQVALSYWKKQLFPTGR